MKIGDRLPLRVERFASGGEGVARADDGRVVFVSGGIPGDVALVEITRLKKRHAHGVLRDVIEPGPDRVPMTCVHAVAACGGCDWLAVDRDARRAARVSVVVEQLERLGGVADPVVVHRAHEPGPRTTVRCKVVGDRAGFSARRSNVVSPVESCEAAHPSIAELIVEGRFAGSSEVTLRTSVHSGERIALVDGPTDQVRVASDVTVVGPGGDGSLTERVGGLEWRISARSFFQTSHAGAEALVGAVSDMLGADPGPVADLYAGVGLLGGACAATNLAVAVESNASSCADAAVNLAVIAPQAELVRGRVERTPMRSVASVIADPARRGLADDGIAAVSATGARTLVLVSCDPASLGRDTGLLAAEGFSFERAQVVDMFPATSQVETVSRFTR